MYDVHASQPYCCTKRMWRSTLDFGTHSFQWCIVSHSNCHFYFQHNHACYHQFIIIIVFSDMLPINRYLICLCIIQWDVVYVTMWYSGSSSLCLERFFYVSLKLSKNPFNNTAIVSSHTQVAFTSFIILYYTYTVNCNISITLLLILYDHEYSI